MTWSRFDDAAPKNPKAQLAGNEAWSLWSAAVMYCNRQLTDGYVTLAALATDCLPNPISMSKARKLAEQLCEARARPEGQGLFERDRNGMYRVHDFLDWNPSKVEVEAKRKKDRDRKRGVAPADSGADSGSFPRGNPAGIPGGEREDSSAPRAAARALPDPPSPSRPAQPTEILSAPGDSRPMSSAKRQALSLEQAIDEDRSVLEFWRDSFGKTDVAFTADRTVWLAERRALGADQRDLLDAVVGAGTEEWFKLQGRPFAVIFNNQERFERYRDIGRDVRAGRPPPAKSGTQGRLEPRQPNTGAYSAIQKAERVK